MNAAAPIRRVLVGYGSESGNARALALRVGGAPVLQMHGPEVLPFNDIDVMGLGAGDVLLAVSSSFGDGEAPANAERFADALREAPSLQGLRYAVFGLGDTGYPRFCGFTRQLDAWLAERKAEPILRRVDADADFEAFFAQWLPVVGRVLNGEPDAGRDLNLQVTAYGPDTAFTAPIVARQRLSGSTPAAWHLELDLAGSGMHWRAGDTLHVVPGNDPALLQALADWYGDPAALTLLQDRELRQLGKSVLRELARLGGSEALKGLLKVSQRAALDAYLHGADVLDILQDHATPERVPLQQLADLLSPCLPRAYSIASSGGDRVVLCLREVRYLRRGRERRGTATGWLLGGAGTARVYCRSNPGFRLPAQDTAPLLMVGTGTGIAPLLGLVQELEANRSNREVHLLFGEKHRAHDFLYGEVLQGWQRAGRLASLRTAFSRDTEQKRYVQHVLAEHATEIASLFARGAHLYVCGNKAHLEGALRGALDGLLPPTAEVPSAWNALREAGRLHCELY